MAQWLQIKLKTKKSKEKLVTRKIYVNDQYNILRRIFCLCNSSIHEMLIIKKGKIYWKIVHSRRFVSWSQKNERGGVISNVVGDWIRKCKKKKEKKKNKDNAMICITREEHKELQLILYLKQYVYQFIYM